MTINEKDWENTKGPPCPSCREETLRLIDGLCPRKKASEIFAAVDPGLTVIDGGTRHYRRKKKAKKLIEIAAPALEPYNPPPVTEEQWEKAQGEICPICRKETQQLIPYGFTQTRKACKQCIARRKKLLEYKARVVAPRFRRRPEKGIL